ncbi:MAG: C25 family cysteine peptidase, partial [Candidatus Sumerlaeia bacterium]|nr:C25 family cysteine peptidase [Candidatus Sumerlaeia bacterium]
MVDELKKENKYYIITSQGANIPRFMQLSKPLRLLENNNGADYLIITHPRFTTHLKPLIDEREKAGLRVFVAEIDDVYDNFSYGCKESYAIKNFIKYVYYKWNPPRLGYVLLVGEASDIQGDPTVYGPEIQEDLIPVYNTEQPETFARADNQYTTITGKLIPDIPIGRFSVNTIEELKTCIEKTLRYPKEQATYGRWRERFLFITDDEPEFSVIAEYLIQVGLPEYLLPQRIYQQEFDYTNFYRVFQRKKSPDATRAIINALNDGVVIYNFFGHGGPNIWTSERLFHVFEDLPMLNNANRLTFLTASSCDTAWLDFPTAPVKSSMGELLLKTPDKGCIGIFAPTTGATPSDHKRLMTHFFTSLFNFNYRRFGEVITATKLLYAMEDSNQQVLDQFVLLGDPYVSFNFDIPEFKELHIEPEIINAKTGGKVKLYGVLPT